MQYKPKYNIPVSVLCLLLFATEVVENTQEYFLANISAVATTD
jgi:hypothetical protein